jgi:hypothetical protein
MDGQPRVGASRYVEELQWLSAIPGLGNAAACLLAAHAAESARSLYPGAWRQPDSRLAGLASACPDRAALIAACATLNGCTDASPEDMARVEALWPVSASTEQLLVSGGDDRLALDPDTGLNKYGCTPWPRPDVINFASCTASSLSVSAFAAAENARRSLIAQSLMTSPARALADASEAIGRAILRHFSVEDLAEAVLAASGTDAALVVTGLLAAEHPGASMTSILVSPSETGSGVPDAVQGRHFASSAPTGRVVSKGQAIDGLQSNATLVTIGLRAADGTPRLDTDIAADCETAVRAGLLGGRVVLHAIDGSKTGLTAPDRRTCQRLANVFGDRLDIVIDACQARIEPAMVRWYLQQGFPVLVTGSKFFGAPGFCGAVLFPQDRLRRISRDGRLPPGLAAYARLQGGFGSRRCPGLVLRWTAALHEMAEFRALPPDAVRRTLIQFGQSIERALSSDDRLRVVSAPRPDGRGWSDCRSVFTFAARGQSDWMAPAELRGLYRALASDVSAAYSSGHGGIAAARCQVGQPVELGSPSLGGLRIAVSAAQLASAEDVEACVETTIRKLTWLLNLAQSSSLPAEPPQAVAQQTHYNVRVR